MDQVFEMKAPLFVTRKTGEEIVVMSKSEYDSMQETFHLLKSPKNAQRIFEALEEHKQGGGEKRDLID